MKKFISVIMILLMLSLAACTNQDTSPSNTGNTSNTQSENITMLDEGVWPVNEYTDGLPVPSGTVAWAMLDTEHENCSISIVDIDESSYNEYMELLKQEGFSVIEDVSEEIKGQDYVSIGTLLSNDEKGLSISYIYQMKNIGDTSTSVTVIGGADVPAYIPIWYYFSVLKPVLFNVLLLVASAIGIYRTRKI